MPPSPMVAAAPSNFAGADAWVNEPYMTDTHTLWAEIEAANPPRARRKRPEYTTPRSTRALADKTDDHKPRGMAQNANVPKTPPPTAEPAHRPTGTSSPQEDDKAEPKAAGSASAEEEAAASKATAKTSKAAAKAAKAGDAAGSSSSSSGKATKKEGRAPSPGGSRKGAKSPGRPKAPKSGRAGSAKSARSASPKKKPLVQPEWNGTGPPRRAPGEVINKWNHQGLMQEAEAAPGWRHPTADPTEGGMSTMSVGSSVASAQSRLTTSPSTRCHPNPERRTEYVAAVAQIEPVARKVRAS